MVAPICKKVLRAYAITSDRAFCEFEWAARCVFESSTMLTIIIYGLLTFYVGVQGQLSSKQYNALSSLYSSLGGARWNHNCSHSWNFDGNSDPCLNHWFGVSCSESNADVISLQLPLCNLSGTIPSEIQNLDKLAVLNLNSNGIIDPLPITLWLMTNLNFLVLSTNYIGGLLPSTLGSSLQHADLADNAFTGPIPPIVCPTLKSLNLSVNMLYGPTPDIANTTTGLISLILSKNSLTGNLHSLFFPFCLTLWVSRAPVIHSLLFHTPDPIRTTRK
jgi:hypothetical protein